MSEIHDSFIHGNNFQHGHYCVIEDDVIVGDDVKLGHFVMLKKGTRIKNRVQLDSFVKTTGYCIIGNDVLMKADACIARCVVVNDKAFIGPGVMTNHTKNVVHQRGLKEVPQITQIGYGAIIGSHTQIRAGSIIGDNVYIATGTNIYKDVLEAGIYGGMPVRRLRELPPGYMLFKPVNYPNYVDELKAIYDIG